MDSTLLDKKRKRGNQLVNAERMVLISKLVEALCEGYQSTYTLSKKLNVDRQTIERYRPLADDVISKTKLDRNVIRNLQVKRTYRIIEMIMDDLKKCKTMKEKSLMYNQLAKFSQHLALICGLNVETQVNVDASKLVIIRANNSGNDHKTSVIETEVSSPPTLESPEPQTGV